VLLLLYLIYIPDLELDLDKYRSENPLPHELTIIEKEVVEAKSGDFCVRFVKR